MRSLSECGDLRISQTRKVKNNRKKEHKNVCVPCAIATANSSTAPKL